MKISKFLLSLVLSSLVLTVSAQRPPASLEVRAALQETGKFVNAGDELLDKIRLDLEGLNTAFNGFAEKKSTDAIFSQRAEIVSSQTHFKKLFEGLPTHMNQLPADLKGDVFHFLEKIKSVVDELWGHRQFLVGQIQSGEYKQDPKMTVVYDKLKRCEVLFYDVKILQFKTQWELFEVMERFAPPQAEASIGEAYLTMDAIYQSSKLIFKAIYDQRDSDFRVNLTKLSSQLQAAKSRPSKLTDEFLLGFYNQFLLSATQFETIAKQSLANNPKPSRQGIDPYFITHNDLLLPHMNGDKGMANQLNELIIRAKIPVQAAYKEAPIFKRILPPFLQEKEDTIPDADAFFKKLEAEGKIKLNKTEEPKATPQPVKVGDATLEGFADNNLILLIDVSGSMVAAEKLPLLKSSLEYLLSLMRKEDNISIITFSGNGKIALSPTSASRKDVILKAITDLEPAGISDANKGIALAYQLAEKELKPNGNNRIVLATDGVFEIDKKTKKHIEAMSMKGINLSIFYFNKKEKEEVKSMLSELSSVGKGRYCYMTSETAKQNFLIEAQQVRRK